MTEQSTKKDTIEEYIWKQIIQNLQEGKSDLYWKKVVKPYSEKIIKRLSLSFKIDKNKIEGNVLDFFIEFKYVLTNEKYYTAFKNLESYCYKACWNKIKDGYRSKKKEDKLKKDLAYSSEKIQTISLDERDSLSPTIKKVLKCYNELDKVYQDAIMANKGYGITLREVYEEVCEDMPPPPPKFDTFKKRVQRYFNKLRRLGEK